MKPFFLFAFLLFSVLAGGQPVAPAEALREELRFTDKQTIEALEQKENLRSTGEAVQKEKEVSFRLAARPLPFSSRISFLSFSCGWNEGNPEADNTELSIRFSENGRNWSNWTLVKTDEHTTGEPTRYSFVSELLFFEKTWQFYQLKVTSNRLKKGTVLQSVFLNFYGPYQAENSQNRQGKQAAGNPLPSRTTTVACAQPGFISRSAWGCPQAPWSPSVTTPTHLIVHHSAGANTSSNWAGVVLAIWNQHVTTNGWSDLGYNWLIDPNGVLYEGRQNSSTQDVTGAHFCGFNTRTTGICMLGTYTSQNITTAARNTLINTLAWKAAQRGIDVTGSSVHLTSGLTLNHISGHRQGCTTECPGTILYSELTSIQGAVKAYQTNGCNLTPVSSIDGLEAFSVTPNPTGTTVFLNVTLSGVREIQFRLLDTDGSLLYTSPKETWSGTIVTEIQALRTLPAGTYVLQLWINRQMTSLQVVKQ